MTKSTNALDLGVDDLEGLDAPFEIVDFLLGAAAGVTAAVLVTVVVLT